MSIPSPTGAKLLKSLNIKSTSLFFVTLLSFGIVSILLQTHVYAEEAITETANELEYEYDLDNPTSLLLTADIESNLFRPNYLHIYGEDFDYSFFSYATTVEEASSEIELGFDFTYDKDDLFAPELSDEIIGDMWIRFTRVDNEFEEVITNIPYNTSYTLDPNAPVGQQTVIIKGQLGIRTETFQITYQDGTKVSRDLVSSSVTTIPVNEVISKGTYFGGTQTCVDFDAIIDSKTSNPVERFWLKSVMRCESGCNQVAVSPSGNYHGLFQYNYSTFQSIGGVNIYDGVEQINQTLLRYRAGQLTKWPACNKKAQATMPDFEY